MCPPKNVFALSVILFFTFVSAKGTEFFPNRQGFQGNHFAIPTQENKYRMLQNQHTLLTLSVIKKSM